MPRLSFAALGRTVPEWAQPFARKTLGVMRITGNRLGITYLLERSYRRRLMLHAYSRAVPRIRTSFTPERKPCEIDIEISTRLLRAWHKASQRDSTFPVHTVGDLWDGIARHHHGELLRILQAQDPVALAKYLCNMSRHGATAGITQGAIEFHKMSTSGPYRNWIGLVILDRLVAVAEMVGVLRAENPEAGRWGENLYEDIDQLIGKLEAALGIGIILPEVEGGLFGIDTKSGRLHFHDLIALYAAWRIKGITKQAGGAASVGEIGGGVGRVAYYCTKFGIRNYAIYDLPLVNVLQGYFLIRALPDVRVVLYEEEMPAAEGAIRILPGGALEGSPAKSFDIVLNQDSFPEIDRSTVQVYLREMRRSTRTHFLSINQEAQAPIGASTFRHLVVADSVEEVGGFERLYRFPCWVRAGYVEELYKVL